MTSTSARGSTSITLQFSLDRDTRRRRAGRAVRHRRRPAPPAAGHAQPAHLPQGEPGRPAHPVPLAQLADAAALHGGRIRRDHDRAAHLDDQRRGPGERLWARRNTPCARSSIPTCWPRAASASTRWRPRSQQHNVNLPTGTLWGPRQAFTVQATGQLMNAAAYRPADRRLPQRLARAAGRTGPGDRQRGERQGRRAGSTSTRSITLMVQRQPGTNTVEVVDRIKELLPDFREQMPPSVNLDILYDRSRIHPRIGQRREVHAAADRRAGGAGDLPVPAQRLRHRHSQPGAAHVDHRHLRRHVPARLHARQPLADGAHALGGLRGGRRHRDAGEHRAPHGDGQAAHAGGARGRRARSASPSSR